MVEARVPRQCKIIGRLSKYVAVDQIFQLPVLYVLQHMAGVSVEGRMQSFCPSAAEQQQVPHLVTGKWPSFLAGLVPAGRAAGMSWPELCACWLLLRCGASQLCSECVLTKLFQTVKTAGSCICALYLKLVWQGEREREDGNFDQEDTEIRNSTLGARAAVGVGETGHMDLGY